MTKPPTTKSYATKTPGQVLAQQKLDAEHERANKTAAEKLQKFAGTKPAEPATPDAVVVSTGPTSAAFIAVAPAQPTAVAPPDARTPRERYLDEIAPAAIVGRLIKFTKEGAFITADDEAEIKDDRDFIALGDQTLVGYLKFNDDAPPDRVMGLLYDGFVMPPRSQLGDLDQTQWSEGLSGAPEDPWKHHIYLVLQSGDTGELYTFATSSMTGRRAVGNLLRHYDRMQKTHPDELPVIRLKVGGFNHRDERIGWVHTPVFAVVGRAPRDSAAKPDTSPGKDMNDEIPW